MDIEGFHRKISWLYSRRTTSQAARGRASTTCMACPPKSAPQGAGGPITTSERRCHACYTPRSRRSLLSSWVKSGPICPAVQSHAPLSGALTNWATPAN